MRGIRDETVPGAWIRADVQDSAGAECARARRLQAARPRDREHHGPLQEDLGRNRDSQRLFVHFGRTYKTVNSDLTFGTSGKSGNPSDASELCPQLQYL